MDEKRQNEVVCEVLGWDKDYRGLLIQDSDLGDTGEILTASARYSWFTRDDNSVRLLREAVRQEGGTCEIQFVSELTRMLRLSTTATPPLHLAAALMNVTPAQQVEAALKALGKWEAI